MARLVALYRKPKDPAAFDRYYAATHIPLAKRVPGLRRYSVSRGPVASASGASDLHLVATLYFDTLPDIHAALASSEGQAAAGDLSNFADGGVDLVFFDDEDV